MGLRARLGEEGGMVPEGQLGLPCVGWYLGAGCDARLRASLQIIRKVVRQLGPSDTDDRQEHEELIVEGSLQEPQDLEAEADHFMKYSILHRDGLGAKVRCGL